MTTKHSAPVYAVENALLPDTDLAASLAPLVPVASKIADSAAIFIDKSSKLPDKTLTPNQKHALESAFMIAQKILKNADLIGRLLRDPDQTSITVEMPEIDK
ncbi:hypothetical protein D2E25_0272 [Bifidobacterium goeldii]|uniref:Uncharacterized protein n=1 Tax=Bifidobacterium goeldii TaxID=2306975 RepID=A0A430FM67_9BIFI|nr:hypothetical protein [Bifidobacterium goeldii]RSX53966.1 hypothetical protein D2E25_0272 [Bifidobacterium goeldii]